VPCADDQGTVLGPPGLRSIADGDGVGRVDVSLLLIIDSASAEDHVPLRAIQLACGEVVEEEHGAGRCRLLQPDRRKREERNGNQREETTGDSHRSARGFRINDSGSVIQDQ